MSLDEAKASGAIGLFEDRYGARVRVYSIGEFSKAVCRGPHVEHTGELAACLPNRISIQLRGRHPGFDAMNF